MLKEIEDLKTERVHIPCDCMDPWHYLVVDVSEEDTNAYFYIMVTGRPWQNFWQRLKAGIKYIKNINYNE